MQAAIFGVAPRNHGLPEATSRAGTQRAYRGRHYSAGADGTGHVNGGGGGAAGAGSKIASVGLGSAIAEPASPSKSEASEAEGSGGVGLAAPAVAQQQALSWRERAALLRQKREEGLT